MNRYLATPLILLLGAVALPAIAQDRGSYGARQEANNRSVERESRQSSREDRGSRDDRVQREDRSSRQEDGGKRGQPPQAYSNNGGARGADYGRGGRQESGRQDIATSGFGVPNGNARDYRNNGSGRGNGGYDNRGRGNETQHNGGRHDNRYDGRSNNRYSNQYGYTDYRSGLPRTDRRDHNTNYRHDNNYRGNNGYRNHDNRHYNSWRDHGWRISWNHGWNGHRYRSPSRYYYPRGYSYNRWNIGYRLPLAFLTASYYVNYDTYGLAVPPYGCRWLRVDGDLLLVEIGSGEIVDILYGFYY